MNKRKFYITTAIPYVNGKPHMGHMLEYFQADTIRRYQELLGKETLLLSGADENALKNVQAAEKEGVPIQEFLARNSDVFKQVFKQLGVKLDVFQRGSDQQNHYPGVQKLWQLCNKNGDIYKKSYTGLYCVGCESFKTEKELVNGLCPQHQKAPEQVTEENYFFKLSTYQDQILKLLDSEILRVVPKNKKNETIAFVKEGLEDFSISRSKERAKGVGVPVPNDPEQIIYVWFDALTIYLTGIGYGTNEEKFKHWWPADIHVIGKDINRFHTVYWPAMLLSAGLPLPKQILIHSFITTGGQKMSKSLGNVIDPLDLIKQYGLEPVRYYLLSQIPIDSDGDFTHERFKEVYNADLANGLGNVVARVAKLCEKADLAGYETSLKFSEEYKQKLDAFSFNQTLGIIWKQIQETDQIINQKEPWKIQNKEELTTFLSEMVHRIITIATQLKPFLPETAHKIHDQFTAPKITSQNPLFPRLS